MALHLVVLDHSQAFDHRQAWPFVHLGDQRLDARRRAPNQRLDRASDRLRTHPETFSLNAARRVNSR